MASVDDEILKTLVRIEKALANGSTTSGLGRTASAPTVAGGSRRGNARQPIDRDESSQRKTFRATQAAMQEITRTSSTLNRSFVALNKEVLLSRGNFAAVNRTLRSMPRGLPGNQATVVQENTGPTAAQEAASARAAAAERKRREAADAKGGRRVNTDPWKFLPAHLADFGKGLMEGLKQARTPPPRTTTPDPDTVPGGRRYRRGSRGGPLVPPVPPVVIPPVVVPPPTPAPITVVPPPPTPGSRRDEHRRTQEQLRNRRGPRPGDQGPATPGSGPDGSPLPGRPGRGGRRSRVPPPPTPPSNPADFGPQQLPPSRPLRSGLNDLVGGLRGASAGLIGFTVALAGAIVPLTRDVLMLQAAGIQASSAMGGMYIDAARAGMSLKEYTAVLQSSSAVVTRAGSMAEFNDTLQVSRDRLENLGIFGESATKMSAQLATSTTALGIPQGQLADATNAQIATFERLRKTSLMTAEQMADLTKSLASNQTVQSQLLGMAPSQRAARMDELMQIKTIGLSMGSTKEASDALGDALIATRNLTAPKRFEAAGRIRQAGAMFGMDPGSTERLATLSRKKIRTADEDREIVRLYTPLQAAMERSMQSGNIAQENMAEQMSAAFDGTIGDVMKKAGNVGLTAESGPAGVNKDFAKGTSDLVKAAGRLLAWSDGLGKNEVLKGIGMGALGLIVGRAIGGGIAGGLGGLLGSINGMISGTISVVRAGLGKIFGLINPMNWIRGIRGLGGLGGIGNTLTTIFNSIRGMLGGLTRLGPLAAGAMTFLKRVPLIGAAIDGLGELFTGNVNAAFNGDTGNIAERAGNILFAVVNGAISGLGKVGDMIIGVFTDNGPNFENMFNRWAVMLKSGLMGALAWAADFIPGIGGKMSAYFKGAAKDSDTVLRQLEEDKTSTVSSIGEQRTKEIEGHKKSTAAEKDLASKTQEARSKITAANAGILTTTTGITGGIIASARAVATPVSPTPQTVTPPTVNKPEPAPAETADEKAAAEAAATTPQTDAIVAQLVAMTGLLQSMLTAEELQAAGIGSLASAAGRPTFMNNDLKFDLLQGSRYTG